MKKGKAIVKGIYIGVVIFIIVRVVSRLCLLFYDKFMIGSASSSSFNYFLGVVLNVLYFSCRPLSTIFCIWEGNLIQNHPVLLKYAVYIFRGLDLLFWVSLSVLILFIRNRPVRAAAQRKNNSGQK